VAAVPIASQTRIKKKNYFTCHQENAGENMIFTVILISGI
jgi:hypothetical protein